ncbi:MAG: hypothetical protein NVS9B15_06490 [Acidobacteriaceae bacterium]
MWIAGFVVLLIAWLVLWLGLHIAGGLIHLLVVLAIISLICTSSWVAEPEFEVSARRARGGISF